MYFVRLFRNCHVLVFPVTRGAPDPWLVRYIFLDKLRVILCVKGGEILNDEKVVQITDIRSLETGQSLPQHKCVEIHRGRKSRKDFGLTSSKNGEIPEYDENSRKRQQSEVNKSHITDEWELFANILDRLFMLIYLCLTIANSVVFFLIMDSYNGQDLPFE